MWWCRDAGGGAIASVTALAAWRGLGGRVSIFLELGDYLGMSQSPSSS